MTPLVCNTYCDLLCSHGGPVYCELPAGHEGAHDAPSRLGDRLALAQEFRRLLSWRVRRRLVLARCAYRPGVTPLAAAIWATARGDRGGRH